MFEDADVNRRAFLERVAMMIGAARSTEALAQARVSRELAVIGRATQWLNSPRLTPDTLSGKVVLVQFWTYTCINWLRTLPYIRAWAQKYREQVVVVGVHTPEFGFEHDIDNVRRAVRQLGVEYPVVIDNDYSIWRGFENQYWPALYFVDAHGRVRDHQFGEGEYQRSESIIQRLLAETGVASVRDAVSVEGRGLEAPADWVNVKSPETYVGYDRAQNFASRGGLDADRRHTYAVPARLSLNQWALAGDWTIGKQATMLNAPNGRVVIRFHARDVHLVMGPPRSGTPVRVHVSIDGQPPGAAHGLDVDDRGNGTIGEPRLYQLIRQPGAIVDRQLELEFLDAGVEIFAFTFG